VTRYLLDTNIVSEARRPQANPALEHWYSSHAVDDLHIAAFTIGEIQKGVLLLPAGRKRKDLEVWFAGTTGPQSLFRNRILALDESAALEWATLIAEGFRVGKPRSGLDMIVAAIALANNCTLVTASERHFESIIPFINPMRR
jgi:predicted nucleic acid-binding protein